jgi:hypothetical protein
MISSFLPFLLIHLLNIFHLEAHEQEFTSLIRRAHLKDQYSTDPFIKTTFYFGLSIQINGTSVPVTEVWCLELQDLCVNNQYKYVGGIWFFLPIKTWIGVSIILFIFCECDWANSYKAAFSAWLIAVVTPLFPTGFTLYNASGQFLNSQGRTVFHFRYVDAQLDRNYRQRR